jgi:hypothetical protein
MRNHPQVALIAVKVLLAPGFVVLASLAGRRFGTRTGGMLGGLPVVAAPILLVYALQHGDRFAANASAATVLGLLSLMGFLLAYAWLAGGRPWWLSLPAGWAVFALFTFIFSFVKVSAVVALLVVALALFAMPALLPRAAPAEQGPPVSPPPSWDLPLRAAAALALVLALTAAAGWLGPQVSGLLAPFPVIASVLAVFTHSQRGHPEVLRLLRGLLLGYAAYALFCFALALTLRPLGTAAAFAVAIGVALLCQAAVIWRQRIPGAAGVGKAAESAVGETI